MARLTLKTDTKLSPLARLVIGIAGLPSAALAVMLVLTLFRGGAFDIGAFEVLYAIAGLVALYIAVTGRRLF